MRVDEPAHVARLVAELGEGVFQLGSAFLAGVVNAVDVFELVVFLVADAAVDEHQAVIVLDQQAAQRQRDAVAGVGGDAALPQRLRHDAEHGAAVEVLRAALEGVAPQAAYAEAGVHLIVSRSASDAAPHSRARRSIRERHFDAATASPVARWRPSISIPKW